MGEFSQDTRLELVRVDGAPSHYREKLSGEGHAHISETTASYLQTARSINATAYINSAVKNTLPSSEGSVTSSDGNNCDSRLTTPEIPESSDLSPASLGLGIEIHSKPAVTPVLLDTAVRRSMDYGRRLLPQIMDDLAACEPERIVFSLASFSNGLLRLKSISAQQFSRAVDKTAWWLRDQVGTPESIQPMAYIGPRVY